MSDPIDPAAVARRLRQIADFLDDHGIGMGDHSDAPVLHAAADLLDAQRAAVAGLVAAAERILNGRKGQKERIQEWANLRAALAPFAGPET
jgi:hypothetical protein